jgi:hypothetical protein
VLLGLLDTRLFLLAGFLLARLQGVVRVDITGTEREQATEDRPGQQSQGTTPGGSCRERA